MYRKEKIDMIDRVLNFGCGTQSTYLLFLIDRGELPPVRAAVFSDLGWEPDDVYRHLDRCQKVIKNVPIIVLKVGNIRKDALRSAVRGVNIENGPKPDGVDRWASMPLYTRREWMPNECDLFKEIFLSGPKPDPDEWSLFPNLLDFNQGNLRQMAELTRLHRGLTVVHQGMIRRQCTAEYKIDPITKWIRENIIGLAYRQRAPKEVAVDRVMGISFDERTRMTDSREVWARNSYPLVEMKLTRDMVIERASKLFPGWVLPRSACLGCPYHSNAEWRTIRDNPAEWADVVEFDAAIRNCGGLRGQMFLHRDCQPLDEVDLTTEDERTRQMDFSSGMANECAGMCGV